MEHKCLNCGTEMIVHNDIKLDMIDNPYVGQILFECPNCRQYRKTAYAIASIFEARDRIDAGESVLGCNNFDDFLKKLEEEAWNNHVENWKEWEAKNEKKIDSTLIVTVFWTVLLILMIVAVVAYAILCAWVFFAYADTPVTELPAWVWWIMHNSK